VRVKEKKILQEDRKHYKYTAKKHTKVTRPNTNIRGAGETRSRDPTEKGVGARKKEELKKEQPKPENTHEAEGDGKKQH